MNINDANKEVIIHLQEIIEKYSPNDTNDHLIKMTHTLLANIDNYPVDKTSRWIGFIQGVLYTDGLIDIKQERDFTRPLYHAVYTHSKQEIPATVTLHD